MAAPAKHSRCSLPWTKGIFSFHLSWPWTWSSYSHPSCQLYLISLPSIVCFNLLNHFLPELFPWYVALPPRESNQDLQRGQAGLAQRDDWCDFIDNKGLRSGYVHFLAFQIMYVQLHYCSHFIIWFPFLWPCISLSLFLFFVNFAVVVVHWGVIALQYCVGLCHIHQHESATGIHMSPASLLKPFLFPAYPILSHPIGCHSALDWTPCVTQQIPSCYLFYIC